jgi:hypothetical protein
VKKILAILSLFAAFQVPILEAELKVTISSGDAGSGMAAAATSDISSALANIEAAGGGILTIPAGTYYINSALTVTNQGTSAGPIRITGAGQSSTTLNFTGTGIALSFYRYSFESTIAIDNLTLSSAGPAIGVEVTGPQNPAGPNIGQGSWDFNEQWHKTINWSNVTFQGFHQAAFIDYATWNSNITGCTFIAPAGAVQSGSNGLTIGQTFYNSICVGCQFTGFDVAIQLTDPTEPVPIDQEGLQCIGCTFSGVNTAINCTGQLGIGWINILNCTIGLNSGGWGITLYGSSFVNINNTKISGTSGAPAFLGIYIEGGAQGALSGNTFNYVANGIVLSQNSVASFQFGQKNTVAFTVTKNSFSNGTTAIWFQGANTSPPDLDTKYCVVTGNTFQSVNNTVLDQTTSGTNLSF